MASPAKAGGERHATDGQVPSDRVPAAASLGEQQLPVSSLREAIPHLRRPFTPQAIKFKVQSVLGDNKGALIIAYIDARLAIERLNAVLADKWKAGYEPIQGSKLAWCFLTIDGVTRTDVGESSKGMSKDLVSDALKRAAVHFGVGVSIYALPQITIWMNDGERRLEHRKNSLALTEHGHTKLREGYAKWLAEHGERLFGPALDHGDVEGATVSEPESEEFTSEKPVALSDARAMASLEAIKATVWQIHALPGGEQAMPWGKVHDWIGLAQHSHEELDRLNAFVLERKAEIEAAVAKAEVSS